MREEFARLNELTGSLTLASGVQARAGDKSMVDSLEGTIVWEYDSMACPQTIVQRTEALMQKKFNEIKKICNEHFCFFYCRNLIRGHLVTT